MAQPPSNTSEVSQPILTPMDIADLSSHGLVGPKDAHGMRRLHCRRTHRFSDEENQHIPLDVDASSDTADYAFVTIPDELISLATLIYVGYSTSKANELWDRWCNRPATGPRREIDADDGGFQVTVTFEDLMVEHIGVSPRSPDTRSEDDHEWNRCLDAYGMSTDVQAAIMDPVFKYLRLGETCAYWARDTIAMRYAGLLQIQRASRERETALRRAASRPARAQPASSSDRPV